LQKAQAETETAQTGSKQAQQNFLVSGENYSRQMLNALPTLDEFTDDKTGEVNHKALTKSLDIIRKGTDAVGLPKHPSNLLGQMEEAVAKKDYDAYEKLRTIAAKSSGTPSEQFQAKFPAIQFQSLGGTNQGVATGNPQIAETTPGSKIGKGLEITPAPLPYGQREERTGNFDLANNPTAIVKDEKGRILGEVTINAGTGERSEIRPVGSIPTQSAKPTTPVAPQSLQTTTPVNAPLRAPAYEGTKTLDQLQAERTDAKEAASGALPALRSIDAVMNYLPLAQTGNLSGAISGMQSTLGAIAGSKPEEVAASARQIIQKNIADLSLAKNKALGGKFAENLKLAEDSLANAEKNPTAIAKSMEQLRPLIQHSMNYYTGLENSIATHGNSPFVKRQYDREMADAFDPLALQMGNAFKSGGKEGLDKFITKNHIKPEEEKKLFERLDKYQKIIKGDF